MPDTLAKGTNCCENCAQKSENQGGEDFDNAAIHFLIARPGAAIVQIGGFGGPANHVGEHSGTVPGTDQKQQCQWWM